MASFSDRQSRISQRHRPVMYGALRGVCLVIKALCSLFFALRRSWWSFGCRGVLSPSCCPFSLFLSFSRSSRAHSSSWRSHMEVYQLWSEAFRRLALPNFGKRSETCLGIWESSLVSTPSDARVPLSARGTSSTPSLSSELALHMAMPSSGRPNPLRAERHSANPALVRGSLSRLSSLPLYRSIYLYHSQPLVRMGILVSLRNVEDYRITHISAYHPHLMSCGAKKQDGAKIGFHCPPWLPKRTTAW